MESKKSSVAKIGPLDRLREEMGRDHNAGRLRSLVDYVHAYPEVGDSVIAEEYLFWADDSFDPEPRKEITTGSTVGHFRIVGALGKGGQGIVYEAEDLRVPRRVALKVLLPSIAEDFGALRRILREAEIAARIDDPSIVTVFEVSVEEPAYIAMRYIDGPTLAEIIAASSAKNSATSVGGTARDEEVVTGVRTRRRMLIDEFAVSPRDPERIKRLVGMFETLARSIHNVHERGIIHRDIKPANIMVDESGRPVLLDFGVAADSTRATTVVLKDFIVGTWPYMSPEQLSGNAALIDRRSDLFSLAVCLFECIAPTHPFRVGDEDIRFSIKHRDAKPLADENPSAPHDLSIVLERALDRSPDRRFATMLEFADELGRILRNEPISTRRSSPIVRHFRWIARNPGWATALYFTILSIAAIVVVLESGRREESRLNVEISQANSNLRAEEKVSRARLGEVLMAAAVEADRRGDWKASLAAYDEAENSGFVDTAAIARGRIRAHLGAFDVDAARDVLAAVKNRTGGAGLPPELLLADVDLDFETAADPDKCARRLERLKESRKLGADDAAFVDARLETSFKNMREKLEAFLAERPWYREAEFFLAAAYAASGDVAALESLKRSIVARRPNDPAAAVVDAMAVAVGADFDRAARRLRPLRDILPKARYDAVETVVLSFGLPVTLLDGTLVSGNVMDLPGGTLMQSTKAATALKIIAPSVVSIENQLTLVGPWSHLVRKRYWAFCRKVAGVINGQIGREALDELTTLADDLGNGALIAAVELTRDIDAPNVERAGSIARRPEVGLSHSAGALAEILSWGGLLRNTRRAPDSRPFSDDDTRRLADALARFLQKKKARIMPETWRPILKTAIGAELIDEAIELDRIAAIDRFPVDKRIEAVETALRHRGERFAIVVADRILAVDPKNAVVLALRAEAMRRIAER